MGNENKKKEGLSEFDELFIKYMKEEPAREEAIRRLEGFSKDIDSELVKGSCDTKKLIMKKAERMKRQRLIDWIKMFSAIIKENYKKENVEEAFGLVEELIEKVDLDPKKAKELKDNLSLLMEEGAEFWLSEKVKALKSLSKNGPVSYEISKIRECVKKYDLSLKRIGTSSAKLDLLEKEGYSVEPKNELEGIKRIVENRDAGYEIERLLESLKREKLTLADIKISSRKLTALKKKGYINGAESKLEMGRKRAEENNEKVANDFFQGVAKLLEKAKKSPEYIGTSEKELKSCEPDFFDKLFSKKK